MAGLGLTSISNRLGAIESHSIEYPNQKKAIFKNRKGLCLPTQRQSYGQMSGLPEAHCLITCSKTFGFPFTGSAQWTCEKCESVGDLVKCYLCCYLCWYKTNFSSNLRYYLGLRHNIIKKLANEAQTQDLEDHKLLVSKGMTSSSKLKLLPTKFTRRIDRAKTRKRIMEIEHVSEVEDNNVQTETENNLDDDSQTWTTPCR